MEANMQEKKKTGGISFWKSISFRIMITVVILLLIVTLVLVFTNQATVKKNVDEYYALSGRIVSEIAALSAEKYGNDFDAFTKSEAAEVLQRICKDYEIEQVYIEVTTQDQMREQDVLEITENEIRHQNHKTSDMIVAHSLTKEEESIFQGKVQTAISKYKYDGKEYISFLHGLYDADGNCYAVCGVDFLDSDLDADVREASNKAVFFIAGIFVALLLLLALFLHRQILSPVKKISSRMRGFVDGEELSGEKLEVRGSDEFAQMARDFNTMNDEIHEYIRTMETVNAAASIQAGMIPAPEYETDEVKIDACMKPAKNVGGDFYDYIVLPDGRISFVIADVSGKGISAALFMAQVITAIRYNIRQVDTPADLLRMLNNDITSRNTSQMFVTVFAAIYDPASGMLTWANAGHNPPYLIKDGLNVLDHEPDLLIGLFEDEDYHNVTEKIRPGDILFLYTDGVNEAVSKTGEFLGTLRMEEILKEAGEKAVEEGAFTKAVLKAVEAFAEGESQHDDITMMAIRFKEGWAGNTLTVPADIKEAGNVRDYIMNNPLIPEQMRKKIYLAAEEIFVNICRYAYNDTDRGDLRIDVYNSQSSIELRFTDSGIPYDPTVNVQSGQDYDPDTMTGGLGRLLAFTIMDWTEYRYRNKQNILILRKKLEKGDF